MAVQRFTVKQYLDSFNELPLPNGDEIEIVDSSEAIKNLTVDDIQGLAGNRVTLLNAIDNTLALNFAQFEALGSVGFSAEDKVILRDTQDTLQIRLNAEWIQALSQKGFSVIDVEGVLEENPIGITTATAMALLASDLAFDESDSVNVQDNGKLGFNFFSAPEIMALGSKGIDSISFVVETDLYPIKLGAVQAKALADSGISLGANAFRILADDERTSPDCRQLYLPSSRPEALSPSMHWIMC
ncbi:hypothetical protein AAII07_40735 [Microvirga sp. 0TCS3.31]